MSRKYSRLWIACFAGLLLMFGLMPGFSHAATDSVQSTVEWFRDYGSNSAGNEVIPTSDGGYIAVGGIFEAGKYQKAYILKLDAEGQVEWEQKPIYPTTNSMAYRVIETKDGGYLVAGNTNSEDVPIVGQLYIIRLDSSGNVLWEKVQDDTIHSTPTAIVETEDGDFFIAGSGSVGWVAYEKAYILKIDINGETLWYNKYNYTDSVEFNDLIPANDGGYMAVGSVGRAEYESGDLDAMLMVKIDDQGKEVWSKQFKEQDSRWSAFSITASEDGGYVIGSGKRVNRNHVNLLTKTDLNGQVQWEKTYRDGTNSEYFKRLVRTKDGYAMLGQHISQNSLDYKNQYDVLSVDGNGELISRELFKGPPINNVGSAAVTPDGGFIFPGTVKRGDVTKFQLMKLSPLVNIPPDERTLTGISFTEKDKQLKAGTNVSTVLQAVYSDGTKSDLSSTADYVSADSAIVEIDALGRITGHEPGSTYVEATYEGFAARLNATVFPEDTDEFDPVSGYIKLDSYEYSLAEGTMLDLRVILRNYINQNEIDITRQTTFTSDHPDIAEVDEEGNLIGHKRGITKIYAQYKGSIISANVLVVRASVPKEDLQPDSDESAKGAIVELSPFILPD
ncbi:hypothetical protein P4H67_24885 [Paenibacillus lautus]|uniref:hypothetical protein n=1 Tax=Paenibacillus lautus TaxID=1401 RepID=UPI002DB91FDE|nr:hypothetical protein [Paenibacillus lautus]MEC0309992.1 hypothetical protein [Paenibacillus lautus]